MNKILGYLFLGFSLFLPLKTGISNLFAILIFAGSLTYLFIHRKTIKIDYTPLKHTTAFIFLVSLLGLIWSFNLENGVHILGKQVSLLMIPISFLFLDKEQYKHFRNKSFKGLLIGVFLVSVILISANLYKIYSDSKFSIDRIFSSFYTSHRYTSLLDSIDPSYLGIYSVVAMGIVLFNGVSVKRYVKILFLVIVSLNVLFINSRMVLLILFFLIIYKILLLNSLRMKLWIGTLLGLFIFSSIILLKDTYVFKKAVTGTMWELSYNVGTANTTDKIKSDSRYARWDCAINEGKKNFFFGTGLGTELDVLLPCYEKNNMKTAQEKKFNTHNQFLSYFITLGILGALIYVYLFLVNIRLAVKRKDWIALFFFIALCIMSLIENIMARNAGIIFLAMYTSLFHQKKTD